MGNISTKLNLAGLHHTRMEMKGQNGMVEVLIIPIEKNNLYKGEKGLYLNLTHIEVKNKTGDSKDTHLVKQDLNKEIYNAMTEEQKKAMPILGNSILWGSQSNEATLAPSISEDEALPF